MKMVAVVLVIRYLLIWITGKKEKVATKEKGSDVVVHPAEFLVRL